jgi:drug/metabolite transporter (DMT)-like permease
MSKNPRLESLLEALLVTFLWSASYVLIKIGLRGMSPLSFAAIRYSLAFVALLAFSMMRRTHEGGMRITVQEWLRLLIAGVAGYTVAQGLQFVGLSYLSAVTTTFLLNFTPLFVVLLGVLFLGETPTMIQVTGMVIALVGAYIYFLTPILTGEIPGVLVILASGLGWAIYMIVVRGFQRAGKIGTFRLTTITMGCGAIILLVSALVFEGLPTMSLSGAVIIVWLSLVNTAFAFYLWNRTLRDLKAYELSMLQNTMLIQIALLASVFLDEQLTPNKVLGIVLVLTGVTLVQIHKSKSPTLET